MIKILEKSIIFDGIEPEKIEQILKNIKYEIKKYKKNNSIVFRGDVVDGIKIILKGSITTEMLTSGGSIKKIEDLKQTDVLASAFIFGNKNFYPVDLLAKEDVEILSISKAEFLKILSQNERILRNFLDEISNKTQLLSKKIWSSVNNKTIRDKFNQFIREKHKNHELEIESIKGLAERFGVARPSLSRVLGEYLEKGVLKKIARNKYKILDKTLMNKKN